MNNQNQNFFFAILPNFLESGLPLLECLSYMSDFEEFDEEFCESLLKVSEGISSGYTFAFLVAEHLKLSDPVVVKLIENGEEAGILSDVLRTLGRRINFSEDIAQFFFDVHLLLSVGVPIAEGLEICSDKYKNNKKFSEALIQIKNKVLNGSEINDAFAQYPNFFDRGIISLIKVGAECGTLGIQFMNIAEILNNRSSFKEKSFKNNVKKNFSDPDFFEQWIDSNPFPLAIVLREYISLKDDDLAKFRLLLKFFECAVAFLSTIYFGAFRENEKKFSLIKNVLKDDKKIQFKRLTFGDWVQIYALISKQTRILLDQDKELCKEIFNDNELLLPKVLSNKKLVNIFLSALEIRNTQEAHGSWVDEEEAINMNNKLFKLLELFKNNMGDIWDQKELIRVESSEVFSEQNILHQYSNLMGSHTIFKKKSKNIPQILFKDNLYLISSMNLRPIKLEIFMQIAEAPKKIKNACYFYNKINSKGKPHFISYHYSNTIEGSHSNQLLDLISEFE